MNPCLEQSFSSEEFINRVDEDEQINRLLDKSMLPIFHPEDDIVNAMNEDFSESEHNVEDDILGPEEDMLGLDDDIEIVGEHVVVDTQTPASVQRSIADDCSQMIQQITYLEQRIRATYALMKKDILLLSEVNHSLKHNIKRLKKIGFK